MVAIMDEAAELEPGQKVLEVGAGSGYHAATIAEIIGSNGHVYTVEIIEALVRFARTNLGRAGYGEQVTILLGDGSLGYADKAPYDRIVVTAAAPRVPRNLLEQLRPGGALIIPVGGRFYLQELVRVKKSADGRLRTEQLGSVSFVPLVGQEGYDS